MMIPIGTSDGTTAFIGFERRKPSAAEKTVDAWLKEFLTLDHTGTYVAHVQDVFHFYSQWICETKQSGATNRQIVSRINRYFGPPVSNRYGRFWVGCAILDEHNKIRFALPWGVPTPQPLPYTPRSFTTDGDAERVLDEIPGQLYYDLATGRWSSWSNDAWHGRTELAIGTVKDALLRRYSKEMEFRSEADKAKVTKRIYDYAWSRGARSLMESLKDFKQVTYSSRLIGNGAL